MTLWDGNPVQVTALTMLGTKSAGFPMGRPGIFVLQRTCKMQEIG
jgi:hypothetical protein